MTNENITIEKAIAQYEVAIEKEYIIDGKIDRADVWNYTNLLNALEVLSAVVVENQDDDEAVELFEELANIENSIKKAVRRIAEDDYVLGDWAYNTEYHEYNETVMTIVENFVKMLND